MIQVMLLDRDGYLWPISYTKESSLQDAAERFDACIFFWPEPEE